MGNSARLDTEFKYETDSLFRYPCGEPEGCRGWAGNCEATFALRVLKGGRTLKTKVLHRAISFTMKAINCGD